MVPGSQTASLQALKRPCGTSSESSNSKQSAANKEHTCRFRHAGHDTRLFLRGKGGAIPVHTHENLKATEVEIGRVRTLSKGQQVGGLSSHRPTAIDNEPVRTGDIGSECWVGIRLQIKYGDPCVFLACRVHRITLADQRRPREIVQSRD